MPTVQTAYLESGIAVPILYETADAQGRPIYVVRHPHFGLPERYYGQWTVRGYERRLELTERAQ